MRKIISCVLLLALCLSLIAGCAPAEKPTTAPTAAPTQPKPTEPKPTEPKPTEPKPTKPAVDLLENARAYLAAMYKDDRNTIARRDYTVVASVMVGGESFAIEWTTDTPDHVTITVGENNEVNIDINEEPTEEVNFKLIATMKNAEGKTVSVEIPRIIEAVKATGVEWIAAPVAETAYKYAVAQNNLGQTLYFAGVVSGNYLATTTNPFESPDVFVEEVEGGMRLYFMNGEAKTYIEIVDRGNGDGKVKAALTTEPTGVLVWDAERKTFTTTVNDATWYLGCYGTYNTFSASDVSYIADITKIGVSQFPAGLYIVDGFMDLQPEFETNTIDFATMTPAEIVDYAYALKDGESAPAEATLTGVISAVNSAWSDTYGNITVTINVDGIEGKPIECFRMKGDYANVLVVGDKITVTGILKNFGGKIEFDAGCKLDKLSRADMEITGADQNAILDAAAALVPDQNSSNTVTLVGTITEIDAAYNEQYKNISVVVSFEGREATMLFYRLKGEGAAELAVGDKITATGNLNNYKGNVQLKNGVLDSVVKA